MAKRREVDEASSALGGRIRDARLDAKPKLTQQELAKSVGVTKGAVSQWEKGDVKNLRNANLFALADRLGVEARWLATGQEPRQRQSSARLSPADKAKVEEARRALANLSPAQRDLFIHSEELRQLIAGAAFPPDKMAPDWAAPTTKKR